MKKIFISAAILLTTATVFAQSSSDDGGDKTEVKKAKKHERIMQRKMDANEVSYQSKQSFFRDFGDLSNVLWSHTDYFDEATFTKDGHAMTAYYDIDAELVGTTSERSFSDLPANAQKFIGKKFKDYTPVKTFFFDDNEANDTDMILYGSEFDDEDNYFVEMQNGNKKVILQVPMNGAVKIFKEL